MEYKNDTACFEVTDYITLGIHYTLLDVLIVTWPIDSLLCDRTFTM